jgi:hypothetical protein
MAHRSRRVFSEPGCCDAGIEEWRHDSLIKTIQKAINDVLSCSSQREAESGNRQDLHPVGEAHTFATAFTQARERDPLPVHPWFESDGTRYSCPQIPRIGFYLAAQILRSVLMANNSYRAGELVLNEGYNGPAIQLLYTAAYHLLYGWLAAHGRLIVEEPHGRPSVQTYERGFTIGHEELEGNPQRMIIYRTRAHKWQCTKAQRNHGMLWTDVAQAVGLCSVKRISRLGGADKNLDYNLKEVVRVFV